MFDFIKKIAAPTVFTKGLMQYKLGNYEISRSLLLKAGSWTPSLESDDLYKALILLIDIKMGSEADIQAVQEVLASLSESPHKDADDYQAVATELKQVVDENGI